MRATQTACAWILCLRISFSRETLRLHTPRCTRQWRRGYLLRHQLEQPPFLAVTVDAGIRFEPSTQFRLWVNNLEHDGVRGIQCKSFGHHAEDRFLPVKGFHSE